MKTTIILIIDEHAEENVNVKAFSKTATDIFITAPTVDAAKALIDTATKKADEAAASWKPEPEEHEAPEVKADLKHYVTGKKAIEDMDADAKAYEETPAGQRFVKKLENAKEFYSKHSTGGLLVSNAGYLANKHHNNLLQGVMDLTALAYRRGYKDAQKEANKGGKVK